MNTGSRLKHEDFCGVIARTYSVENYLDLSYRHLRNDDISKVLVILFPKKSIYLRRSVYNICSDGYTEADLGLLQHPRWSTL